MLACEHSATALGVVMPTQVVLCCTTALRDVHHVPGLCIVIDFMLTMSQHHVVLNQQVENALRCARVVSAFNKQAALLRLLSGCMQAGRAFAV